MHKNICLTAEMMFTLENVHLNSEAIGNVSLLKQLCCIPLKNLSAQETKGSHLNETTLRTNIMSVVAQELHLPSAQPACFWASEALQRVSLIPVKCSALEVFLSINLKHYIHKSID